jgi:hypothetical protein
MEKEITWAYENEFCSDEGDESTTFLCLNTLDKKLNIPTVLCKGERQRESTL